MNPSDIYQTYTEVLQELNRLQSEYRAVSHKENNSGERQHMQDQIRVCQDRLLSVTDQLIYDDPFQEGKRVKHGKLNEMLI